MAPFPRHVDWMRLPIELRRGKFFQRFYVGAILTDPFRRLIVREGPDQ